MIPQPTDKTHPMPLTVTGFDHIVLMVRDQEASLRFYGNILGMEQLRVSDWRQGVAPFPSVRISSASIIDLLARGETTTNTSLDHFCLVIDSNNWPNVIQELESSGVAIEGTEPRKRWGALGWGQSILIQDPDGHRIELKRYPSHGGA